MLRVKLYMLLLISVIIFWMTSCVVQAPKYTPVENILDLKLGMSREEVSQLLDIPPYDLKSMDSSGYVLIYKYRVTDRNTIPLFLRPNNGVKARGKWVDLFIAYSPEGKVVNINSCSECSETEVKERRIDLNALITIVTLTIPTVLIFLKLE